VITSSARDTRFSRIGFAWCHSDAINRLPTFREDFIPHVTPTSSRLAPTFYENMAVMEPSSSIWSAWADVSAQIQSRRRVAALKAAMNAIATYERTLSRALLEAVTAIDGAVVHGISDVSRLADRVPTVCFTVAGVPSAVVAAALAAEGNMYAPRLTRRIGLGADGMVRVSPVHYNTVAEVTKFQAVLAAAVESALAGSV